MRLIDADALKESIITTEMTLDDFIDAAPTVALPEQKHGNWVRIKNERGINIYCSCCNNMARETLYCPYCGAKMDLYGITFNDGDN